jgi:hypothetical protein
MKARSAVKRVFKHIGVWILWYALQMIQNVKFIRFFRTIEWIQMAYNCISLVIVFYAISATFTTLLEYRRLGIYRDRYRYKILYVFNTHILFCGAIAVSYIAMSMFLDIRFFENIYPDLFMHFFKRFDRVLPYVFAALIYGHHVAYKKKHVAKDLFKDERIAVLEEQNKHMMQWIQEIKNSNRSSLLN